ncbi:hypothetical protein AWA1501_27190 [Lactiplantibacillus pentosus]|uniref:hypothetical protein n=1 Tax=Lactiplantibacillus pentosus TaxID=1589 RepID=UPI001B22B2FF|nr:hypothetical protein [Lactiplantibacillus pentosus]GIP70556.1 hypothetical protein AWA1501_27190 [Lactiplantibacillus pentosus]
MEYGTSFASPSFLSGVARPLDLGSTLKGYNFSVSEQEQDFDALRSDWNVVALDFV